MIILLSTPLGWNEDLYFKEIENHIHRGWTVVEQFKGSERLFTKLETDVASEINKYSVDTY